MLNREHIARGDNLRLLTRPVDGVGALKLIDAFERGTAIIPNGYAVMRGSVVHYRSLAGEVYNAKIVTVTDDNQRCVIDVDLPGCLEPVRLANVHLVKEVT